MSEEVLTAKLYIPSIGRKTIRRTRLSSRLNAAITLAQRLIMVLAPAGFGKTTLIADWLRDLDATYTWISIDHSDRNVQAFVSGLIAGVARQAPSVEQNVVRQKDGTLDVEATLVGILNHIAESQHVHVLVLDDLHLAEGEKIEEVMCFLLNQAPRNLHIVVTTRSALNFPLARLRTQNLITEIDATDLLMSQDETRSFLRDSLGLEVSNEVEELLRDKTEGWAAGLQLAAISLGDGISFERWIQGTEPLNRAVFDFMIEEVFVKQSAEVQHFLLCTANLEKFCPALCDFIVAERTPEARLVLNYLRDANLFVISLDESLQWFRYHHLFQESLRIMQARLLGEKHSSQLLVRASQWFEVQNDLHSAFHYATMSQNEERLAALCERTWESFSLSFKLNEWMAYLAPVSMDYLLRAPVLMVQLAWAQMTAGQFDLSEQHLAEAEQCLVGDHSCLVVGVKEQFEQIHARIAFVRSYNAQNRGHTQRAIECAEHLLTVTTEERDHFLRAQARAVLAASYWAMGRLDAAHGALQEWISHARRTGNVFFAIAGAAGMAQLRADQGLLVDAMEQFQSCIREVQEMPGGGGQLVSHLLLGLSLLHLERGYDEDAQILLQKAKERGAESSLPDWMYRYHLGLARFSEVAGQFNEALFHLDEAQRFFVAGLIPEVKSLEVRKLGVYLLQGDRARVQSWLTRNPLVFDAPVSYLAEYTVLSQLRSKLQLQLFDHDPAQRLAAMSLLGHYCELARVQNRSRSVFELMAMQLQLASLEEPDETSERLFQQLLQFGLDHGYLGLWQTCGPLIETALRQSHRYLRQGERKLGHRLEKYLDNVLQIYIPKPGNNVAPIEVLTERELAVLKLVAEGLSNEEICARLFLALDTVKGHNRRIFNKLQVRRRTEAVVRAQKLGLL